ncbi:hypothetical protein HY967_01425 [Candidatus Jorgensenbacteria bacterium]|nr:hypothetical protein [Candidatus Jorgensenbacteria bacterium]
MTIYEVERDTNAADWHKPISVKELPPGKHIIKLGAAEIPIIVKKNDKVTIDVEHMQDPRQEAYFPTIEQLAERVKGHGLQVFTSQRSVGEVYLSIKPDSSGLNHLLLTVERRNKPYPPIKNTPR